MKAQFGMADAVPLSRVVGDYRFWILPVALALVANIAVLLFVVLPLSVSTDAGARRATEAIEARTAAAAELQAAEQTRDGQAQAARDLDRFYGEVLPADVAAARRLTHLKLSQMAREHDVRFQRSSAAPEEVRGSSLERLRVSYALEGSYEDIRAFIYEIETAPDFLVIDNVFLAEGSVDQAPLTLTLDLSTFYRVTRDAP
jgi:Tfp pilus assembly protein PilO